MVRHGKSLTATSRNHRVRMATGRGKFEVVSGSSGAVYTVTELTDGRFNCTCDWQAHRPNTPCSHTIAVREWLAEAEGRRVYAHGSEEDAKRSHRKMEDRVAGVWFTSRKVPMLSERNMRWTFE